MMERATPLKSWTKVEQLRWGMLVAELWLFAQKIDRKAKWAETTQRRR